MTDTTLYLPTDGVYRAEHLAQPWGDVIGQGVVHHPTFAFDALKVSALAPAAMGIQVEKGVCWVTNDGTGAAQAYERGGAYRCYFDALQLAIDASTAQPRIDRIVAEVLDSEFIGGGTDVGRLRVVKGTPAASPSAPAEPSTALTLALVTVPASASTIAVGNISDQRLIANMVARLNPGWVTVTGFTNGWTSADAAFYKDPLGHVHMRGSLTPGTANAAAFSFPVGYRPDSTVNFLCAIQGFAGAAQCFIDTAGTATLFLNGTVPALNVSVVNFRAA